MTETFDWDDVEEVSIIELSDFSSADGDSPFPIEFTGQVRIGKDSGTDIGTDTTEKSFSDRLLSEADIAIDTEDETVTFDPEKPDARNMASFFSYIANRGYITESDVPFKTPQQSNYILNSKPRHPDKEMNRPIEVADNIWLETSVPINQKKHHIIKAAQRFVLDN